MLHPVEQLLPDENGLSVDSLRGSQHLIRVDLVNSGDDRRDPYTQQVLTRDELSTHEVSALHNAGILLGSDGQPLTGDDLLDVPSAYRPDPNAPKAAPVSPANAVPTPPPGYVFVDGAYMHVDDYYRNRREHENAPAAESIPPARVGAPPERSRTGQEPTAPNPEEVRPFGAPDPTEPEPPKVGSYPHEVPPTPAPNPSTVPPGMTQPAPPQEEVPNGLG